MFTPILIKKTKDFIKYIMISAVISFPFFSSAAPSSSYDPEVYKENYQRNQSLQKKNHALLTQKEDYVFSRLKKAFFTANEEKQIIELFINEEINKEEAAQHLLYYIPIEEKETMRQFLKDIGETAQHLDNLSTEEKQFYQAYSKASLEDFTQMYFIESLEVYISTRISVSTDVLIELLEEILEEEIKIDDKKEGENEDEYI